MHKILVHAQQAGLRPWAALFLGPWPMGSLAQSTHKSVVHAQECCACTRILCMHKNLDEHLKLEPHVRIKQKTNVGT